MNGKRFGERIAVVTGAGKRMGKQTAQDLASEGAAVVLTDIDRLPRGHL